MYTSLCKFICIYNAPYYVQYDLKITTIICGLNSYLNFLYLDTLCNPEIGVFFFNFNVNNQYCIINDTWVPFLLYMYVLMMYIWTLRNGS